MADNRTHFGFHPATDDTRHKHAALREKFIEFADYLDGTIDPSRELALVKTKLEEAAHWAHKAVALTDPVQTD